MKLHDYKPIIIGAIVVDVMGIYWFLGWKTLGIALLLVLFGFLAYIMFKDSREAPLPPKTKPNKPIQRTVRRKPTKMYFDEENNAEEDIESPQEADLGSNDLSDGYDLGLPNADEYNKRMQDAFGY